MKSPKIITYTDVEKKTFPKDGVLVGGCFDLLHYGHISFLESAKEMGDPLIVALESDEFIVAHKKRTPVHTQQQRAHILAALSVVDVVVKLPFFTKNSDYTELVMKVHPSIIAVTEGDPHIELKRVHAEKYGARVEVVTNLIEGLSSQKILSKFIQQLSD
jgi:cytidyltransferase-like protein